jgi:hypothetical protein
MKNIILEINEPGKLLLILVRKANYIILFGIGLWCLGWFGMTCVWLFNLASNLQRVHAREMLVTCFLVFISLFAIRIFFWHLNGRERIEICDGNLSIQKIGTILSFNKHYALDDIESFELVNEQYSPWVFRLYGLTGGQVAFYYYGNRKLIGQTLTLPESKDLIMMLNQKLLEVKSYVTNGNVV